MNVGNGDNDHWFQAYIHNLMYNFSCTEPNKSKIKSVDESVNAYHKYV